MIWQKTMNLRTILTPEGSFSHIEQQWISDLNDKEWRPIEEVRQSVWGNPPNSST